MSSNPLAMVLTNLLGIFQILLVIWCLLSWFPSIDWYKQPFALLDRIVRPVIEPFRKILPPMGGMDFSPIIAIVCIQFVTNVLISALR